MIDKIERPKNGGVYSSDGTNKGVLVYLTPEDERQIQIATHLIRDLGIRVGNDEIANHIESKDEMYKYFDGSEWLRRSFGKLDKPSKILFLIQSIMNKDVSKEALNQFEKLFYRLENGEIYFSTDTT